MLVFILPNSTTVVSSKNLNSVFALFLINFLKFILSSLNCTFSGFLSPNYSPLNTFMYEASVLNILSKTRLLTCLPVLPFQMFQTCCNFTNFFHIIKSPSFELVCEVFLQEFIFGSHLQTSYKPIHSLLKTFRTLSSIIWTAPYYIFCLLMNLVWIFTYFQAFCSRFCSLLHISSQARAIWPPRRSLSPWEPIKVKNGMTSL